MKSEVVLRAAIAIVAASAASAGAPAQEEAAAPPSAKDELLAHARRFAETPGYTFEYGGTSSREDAEDEGDRSRGAGRGGDPWRVEFERGKPIHYVRGRYDFWVGEKKFSFKDPKEKWTTIDRPDRSAPVPDGAEEPRVLKAFDEVERIPIPHLLLAELERCVTDVKREDDEDGTIYVATLTADAARRFGGLKPRKGAASKEPECAGVLRVTLVDDAIESIAAETTVKAANERRVTRTFELFDVGATALEVPADVAAAQAR